MASVQDCTFIEATICPGYVGTASIWLNKSLVPGRSMAAGGAFSYDGICYSIPANPQAATPPSGASYANSFGNVSVGCPECCAFTVNPPVICVKPGDSGPVTFTVTGKPGSLYTLVWSSSVITAITDNGTPITSPYNATISAGGTDTVGVTVSATAPSGSSSSIAVSGCAGKTVSVTIGGATCSGPQPSSVQITDASDLTFVLGAGGCSGAPANCGCNYSLPLTLTTVSPCQVYDLPNSTDTDICGIGGIAFIIPSIHLANSYGMWSVGMLSCYFHPPYAYGPVGFYFVKFCGNNPAGRYFYQPNSGPVDYTHWIDVE